MTDETLEALATRLTIEYPFTLDHVYDVLDFVDGDERRARKLLNAYSKTACNVPLELMRKIYEERGL